MCVYYNIQFYVLSRTCTTAIAAYELNRKFVCIEKDEVTEKLSSNCLLIISTTHLDRNV